MEIPEDKSPFSGKSPFEILGVKPNAALRDITDAMDELLEDINDLDEDDSVKIPKQEAVKNAYESLRKPSSRALVEIFMIDDSLGEEQCKAEAEKHKDISIDLQEILDCPDDIMPSSPEVGEPADEYREVQLKQSISMKTRSEELERDPKTEALESITFER